MRPWLLLAPLSLLGGCVDLNKCGLQQTWKPCAGETSEPGASGSPPSIVSFVMPTCAYVDAPVLTGTLNVSDADSDEQVAHVTTFQGGVRLAEADTVLDPSLLSGMNWSGPVLLTVAGSSPASFDVRVKVDDVAGGQSQPVCNTVSLVQ